MEKDRVMKGECIVEYGTAVEILREEYGNMNSGDTEQAAFVKVVEVVRHKERWKIW